MMFFDNPSPLRSTRAPSHGLANHGISYLAHIGLEIQSKDMVQKTQADYPLSTRRPLDHLSPAYMAMAGFDNRICSFRLQRWLPAILGTYILSNDLGLLRPTTLASGHNHLGCEQKTISAWLRKTHKPTNLLDLSYPINSHTYKFEFATQKPAHADSLEGNCQCGPYEWQGASVRDLEIPLCP